MVRLLLVLVFTSLMAFSAFVAIKVPFLARGVPRSLPGAEALYQWHGWVFGSHVISAQLLCLWMTGTWLGARRGGLAIALYLALGLGGMPIFTNGGGFAYLQQPTFGYLAAFLPAVIACGAIGRDADFGRTWLSMAMALLIVQVIGLPFELLLRGQFFTAEAWSQLATTQVLQFLPGQLALMTALAFVVATARAFDALYASHRHRDDDGDHPLIPRGPVETSPYAG